MSNYYNLFKESFPSYLEEEVDSILKNTMIKSGYLEDYSILIEDYNAFLHKSATPHKHQLISDSRRDGLFDTKFIVTVDNQQLKIPHRVYFTQLSVINTDFSPSTIQKQIIECMLTRHCDGFIREYFLKEIILLNQSWVVPYVFQLVGEYILEILQVIYENLNQLDLSIYLKFIEENPKFYQLTKARVISYWSCYYRGINKSDYVGFKILDYFDSQLKGKQ